MYKLVKMYTLNVCNFLYINYTSIKLNKYHNLARSGREKLPINSFKGESQKMYKLVIFQALISPGASISTSALRDNTGYSWQW